MNLYCLEIVCAHPDYKRPYASVEVFHFLSSEEANEKRKQKKLEYYSDFVDMLEADGTVIKDIDDVDDRSEQDAYFYQDSYMDMEPFAATLYEIHIEDGNITSKSIPFPFSEKIEGI